MVKKDIESVIKNDLLYNATSGIITWGVKRRGVSFGEEAGTLEKSGYKKIMIERKYYLAHRIAWLLHYGEWPNGIIDHIDGNPSNNKICNLRISTSSLNAANKKRPLTNNSGFKGVSWCKTHEKWYASIKVKGRSKNLGYYKNAETAFAAYIKAAYSHFGDHARAF